MEGLVTVMIHMGHMIYLRGVISRHLKFFILNSIPNEILFIN